jgi:hypothetical protein
VPGPPGSFSPVQAGRLVVKREGPCLDHVDSPEFSVYLDGLWQQAGVRDESLGSLLGHHDRHNRLPGPLPAAEPEPDARPSHVGVVAVRVEYLLILLRPCRLLCYGVSVPAWSG